jgi:hypothetical protein
MDLDQNSERHWGADIPQRVRSMTQAAPAAVESDIGVRATVACVFGSCVCGTALANHGDMHHDSVS